MNLGGVVLSEGAFLGPHEINAMRTVPELVFVNCCHLAARDADQALRGGAEAKQSFDRAEFAMGVADALVGMGVRCVIAAGWAVDDQPAKVFAETFYREILDRRPFIDAVATARQAAWNADRNSNTWAAYQAYGDPDWVYRRGPHDSMAVTRSPMDEFESLSSPMGLALALEEQAVRVEWMHEDRSSQLEKVRHLEDRFAELWGSMGAVAEAFGLAFAKGGDINAAIGWYARALQANDGSASMKAAEQWGKLCVQRGGDLLKTAAPGSAQLKAAREDITNALRSLQALAGLQPTLERHSMCGSAWKRLAMLERKEGDAKAEAGCWDMALRAYSDAEKQARAQPGGDPLHPLMNRLALQWLCLRNTPGWTGLDAADVSADMEAAQASLAHKVQTAPDFGCLVGVVELDLLQALMRQNLAGAAAALTGAFNSLNARLSARLSWAAVADQADMLLSAHAARTTGAEKRAAEDLKKRLLGFAA